VTLIISNPPMGRRVQRGAHADLLERFVAHAAKVLVPGGALVWLVPEPRRIHERAEAVGLQLQRAVSVDMGGFSAELGVYVKRAANKRIVGGRANEPKPREKRKRTLADG
jgi:tRNA G10  N-methylase Trm11